MKKYSQISGEISEFSDLPFWKKGDGVDLAYVGYGLVIVTLVVVSYILGSLHLLPRDPQDIDLGLMMAPPGTAGHLFGTDFMGRDMFSRLIVGIQAYFLPGLLAIFIALFLGTVIGVLAGYRGGKFDTGITYFTNLVDSFPRLVLILLVIAAFKPDIYYIMLVVGLTNVPVVAPLLRATSPRYLGFGVQEPAPSWGNMVQSGANYFMQGKFWPSTAPALAILFTILGFHLLGDGLNNILEGKRST